VTAPAGPDATDPLPPRRRPDPLLAVVVVVAAGLAVIALHQLRAGMYVVAVGVGGAAALRLLLRPRAAGSLVVRGRHTDVLVLAALAVAIAVLAALTPLPGGAGR
jgi:hypothetical protein